MDDNKSRLATKECFELMRNLHQQFAEQLNSGSYVDGQKIFASGTLIQAEMFINSGSGNRILMPTEMATVDAKYKLTFFAIGSPADPIRIGIDNCHKYPHMDIPGVEKRINVPVDDPNNIGICGSIVTGLTLPDSQISRITDQVYSYWKQN